MSSAPGRCVPIYISQGISLSFLLRDIDHSQGIWMVALALFTPFVRNNAIYIRNNAISIVQLKAFLWISEFPVILFLSIQGKVE